MSSLYERLGGSDRINAIANDFIDLHLGNPTIAARFADKDVASLKNSAATFFIMGSGGPPVYQGKDVLSAHRGMNIGDDEFIAVLDDVLLAMERNGVEQREKEEVLYILYSMKSDVVRV